MSITLKKNAKPKLPICEMLCDSGLDPKLNLYDVTKFMNEQPIFFLVDREAVRHRFYTVFSNKRNYSPKHSITFTSSSQVRVEHQ